MLEKIKKIYWPLISLTVAIFAIISVLFLQYIMGFAPCDLCYKQRYVWYAIMAVSLIACFWHHNFLFFTVILLYIASMGYGLYHTGIIYNLWLGPNSCSSGTLNLSSVENFDFSSISDLNYNSLCASVDQKILGIPLSLGNFFISAFGFSVTLFLFRQKKA